MTDLHTQLHQITQHHGLHTVLTTLAELCDDPPLTWIEQVLDILHDDPQAVRRLLRTLDRQVTDTIRNNAHGAAGIAALHALVDTIDQTAKTARADHARAWRTIAKSDQLALARRLTQQETR